MPNQDILYIEQLHNLMKFKPYLLDVRTKKEYCEKHLCSAINIETPIPPLKKEDLNLLQKKLIKLGIKNKHSLIFVYCKKGIRANYAKNILQKLGYVNVLSLGGITTEPLKSIIENKISSIDKKYIKLCDCKNSPVLYKNKTKNKTKHFLENF